MTDTIHVAQADLEQLEQLIDGWWQTDARTRTLLGRLQEELDRARIVENHKIGPERVTLGSEVVLRDLDTGQVTLHRLVLPRDVEGIEGGLSILSPVGIAVLGYGEGDTFECETPGGRRRLCVERVDGMRKAA